MKKLQTFFYQTSTALSIPFPVAFSLEILSSLQIIHLLFFSMAQFSTNSHHFITESLSKNLYFLTGAFPLQETYSIYTSLFHAIWVICLIYFLLHILAFLLIIKVFLQKEQGNRTIMKILSWSYLLHSRIIFFPMQFFLLNLCKLFKSEANGEFYQETGWLIGSIILMTLNTALALGKEFLMYHINQTENNYSVKTNIYHQMMLIYKILALLLCFWGVTETSTAIKGSTFFHVIMSFLMVLILYIKLPFYHFKVLKLAMMLTTVTLCLSLISVIYVFGQDSEVVGGMHILLVLLPPLGIKIVFSQFRNLFKRILQGEFMVVDHAVHYGLLLEQFIASEKDNSIKSKIFFLNRESFYGILVGKNIPLEKFTDRKIISECEYHLYHHIMEKLSIVGNSKLLSLYTAQIYLTKADNIPKALEIIRKLETSSTSSTFPMQTSIEYLNDLLQRAYNLGHNQGSEEGQLELSEYFKYYDLANDIKALMLLETKKQIEFWEDIQLRKTDAKKTYDRVEEIDRLFMRIRKECEHNLNNFRKNFRSPMLLYSIYLSNVRQMHYDGTQVLTSFQSIMLAQNASGNNNNELDVTSGNTAVVVVSLDKIKAGTILNASGAIHNIFNLRKTELIGKKVGCLFPAAIAKKYQQNIHEYSKSPTYKLDHKERTYGKTTTEEIFELEAHFQLYPYVGKELTVMIMLKKLDDPAPILIANNDGMIVDYSGSLKGLFQAENINLKNVKKFQDLNINFEKVNLAFNMSYDENQQQQQMMSARSDNKEKFFFNFDSTAGDFIEDSSRNNSTYRALVHSSGGFGSPEKAKNTPQKRLVKIPSGKSGDGKLSLDKAQMICKEYMEGKETTLFNPNAQKNSRLRAHVQIKPCIIEGEVYKVMSILSLRKDIGSIYDSLENASSRSGLTFGDEFPMDNEGVIVKKVMAKNNPKTKGTMASTGGLEKVSYLINESESESDVQKQVQDGQKKLINIEKFFDQDERSSIKNSSQQESRTVRTLRDIGSRKKLQRSVGYLQILAYLVVGVILILSIVKFSLSRSSIQEIEKGINIINLSTGRLQNVINSWMYGLLLVAGNNFTSTTGNIKINTEKFADYNTRLKNELGLVRDKDFVNRAFQRDITFYQTAVTGDTNTNIIDTFTATNILLTKFLAIQNAKSRTQVMMMPDVTQIFNNTCNDYIISSNNLIYATDTILHDIISMDIRLLDIVLAIEIVAMVGYIAIFTMMVWIISKSYQRLCRALLRTQERSVSLRIAQLNKVKGLLEDDIERKAFIQDAFDLFVEERSMKASKREAKSQNGTSQTNLTMSAMNKHLTLIAVVSLIAIPMFAGLFIGTLVKSINTFNTLGSVNKGLTMLSVGYFQSSLLMSNFIYNMVFSTNPTMMLMNNAPKVQQLKNLNDFNGLNQKLIGSFLSSKEREIDPFLVEILQSNVCKYMDDINKVACEVSTNSQKMGLLSMNTDYYNTMLNVVTSVGPNTTLSQAVVMFAKILPKVTGEMRVMQDIYPVMISHILENFTEEVSSSKQDEATFIAIIFVTVIVYTGFMYLKPLKDFRRVDIGRRKVLKIVPASISQENKALKFYLMQDFKAEIEEIKNTL